MAAACQAQELRLAALQEFAVEARDDGGPFPLAMELQALGGGGGTLRAGRGGAGLS